MTFMDDSFIDTWLINTYGQDIKIYNKAFTKDENNNVTNEYYSNTIETKGWVIPFSSLREKYFSGGYMVDGDYSCVVHGTIPVNPNDKVVMVDSLELEVREVLIHYEFNSVAYKELILRKGN